MPGTFTPEQADDEIADLRGAGTEPVSAVATRQDKLAARYETPIHTVASNEWLRHPDFLKTP